MSKKVSCPSLACLSSEDPGVTGSAEDPQAAASLEGSPRYGGQLMEAAPLHLPAQLLQAAPLEKSLISSDIVYCFHSLGCGLADHRASQASSPR